jgi:hypothetical protein
MKAKTEAESEAWAVKLFFLVFNRRPSQTDADDKKMLSHFLVGFFGPEGRFFLRRRRQ